MNDKYNNKRVLEPKYVLATSAWQLDNGRKINENEIRVAIKKIHLESTSFKQICTEVNDNEEKIKHKIMDIVIRRGKLHNPITDTGGLVYGVVEEIGAAYKSHSAVKVGEPVICNASLASFPIHIERINDIDKVFNQVDAEGYAIVHDGISLIKIDKDVPVELMMFALDESGTLFRLHQLIEGQRDFLVVGNNMLTNLIYGHVIRRSAGDFATITCILDKRTRIKFAGKGLDSLTSKVFNNVHYVDILKPLEAIKRINPSKPEGFDLTVNCAEIPGAETINVLSTKAGGTVLFANLINNLNIALYITESLSKPLVVRGAEGFVENYDKFDIELCKELWPYFESVSIVKGGHKENEIISDNPYIKDLVEKSMLEDFVCVSRPMRAILGEIMNVSKYDCNVIIFGETGVGKEKVANLIQKNSDRKLQPFVKINCGAISPSLIESEFFGYEKGAFTGASNTGKKGYFELAHNGVIFLDEVGELPVEMQAKLLRVIQDGEFYRVGGTVPVKTNVRIISATNRNLEELVTTGEFRRDLYYRLNVVPIHMPQLKDRAEDIPVLIDHFVRKYQEKFETKRGIVDSAVEYLSKMEWPGNVRELENTLQRLIISAKGDDITLMDVMRYSNGDIFGMMDGEEFYSEVESDTGDDTSAAGEKVSVSSELNLREAVDEYEKGLIRYACDKYGSTRRAAKAIGISQTQLVRKKKKYEIT